MGVAKKLEELEREIQKLKSLVLLGEDALFEKRLVSLRGYGQAFGSRGRTGGCNK
jgi:hypothetical protein